jgi:hypothetical protein
MSMRVEETFLEKESPYKDFYKSGHLVGYTVKKIWH